MPEGNIIMRVCVCIIVLHFCILCVCESVCENEREKDKCCIQCFSPFVKKRSIIKDCELPSNTVLSFTLLNRRFFFYIKYSSSSLCALLICHFYKEKKTTCRDVSVVCIYFCIVWNVLLL